MEHYVFVLLRCFLNDKEHFYSCQTVGNELISSLNKIRVVFLLWLTLVDSMFIY